MKMNLRQSLFSFAAVLLSIFTACTDIPVSSELASDNRAHLSVSLDKNAFRTILPEDIKEDDIYLAHLSAVVAGTATTVSIENDMFYTDGEKTALQVLRSAENVYIEAGTYDFTLDLYDQNLNLCQKGVIKNRTVAAGTTNSLAFKTEYLSEGTGSVELYFTWTKDQRISYVSAGLFTDESDGETAVSGYELGRCDITGDETIGYTADYRKDIVAGTYFIRYEVWSMNASGQEVVLNSIDDVIRVLPRRTTKKTIALTDINTLYTIQYNLMADDAQWSDGYTALTERNANKGVTLPTAENVSRSGYQFGGWFESEDDGTTLKGEAITTIAAGTARDVTLYAKWNINAYTVTLDDGTGAAPATQTINHGSTATKPDDPTREGYTFTGWYNGDELYDFDTPITGSLTLLAKWLAYPKAVITVVLPHGDNAQIPLTQSTAGQVVTLTVADSDWSGFAWTFDEETVDTSGLPESGVTLPQENTLEIDTTKLVKGVYDIMVSASHADESGSPKTVTCFAQVKVE